MFVCVYTCEYVYMCLCSLCADVCMCAYRGVYRWYIIVRASGIVSSSLVAVAVHRPELAVVLVVVL